MACFKILAENRLLSKMQLNDLDIFGAIEDSIGKKTLHQDANASEENSEDERDQENDADQREHSNDQIADVVALAQRSCFVPRDLGLVIYGVKKRVRLAATDGAGHDVDQRAATPYEQRVRSRLLDALQGAQTLACNLRCRILNQREGEWPAF